MAEVLQGGTRLQGESPLKVPGYPVISVITIVFNGAGLLEKTIRSVTGQSYPNIEYLIIDGGSTDGTTNIIRQHEQQVSYWISEPDRGIYDAMNKGLALATGDFVWFMNTGDRIYSDDTLEKIFHSGPASGDPPDLALIYYGDTMIVDAEYREVGLRRLRPPEVLTWKSFKKGMVVCHQAILVNRQIAEPFDPQYSHSADYDWVLRAIGRAVGGRRLAVGSRRWAVGSWQLAVGSRRWATHPHINSSTHQLINKSTHQQINTSPHHQILNTHLILCAFLDGGHSKQHIGISLRERFHSMRRHYGLLPTLISHVPIVFRFAWYVLINKRF